MPILKLSCKFGLTCVTYHDAGKSEFLFKKMSVCRQSDTYISPLTCYVAKYKLFYAKSSLQFDSLVIKIPLVKLVSQ